MIVDRHAPTNLFALLPELWLEMDRELAQLDGLLEDDGLFRQVKADLCQRHPNSATLGRRSTPVEVILRMHHERQKALRGSCPRPDHRRQFAPRSLGARAPPLDRRDEALLAG
jgi:hypothetical protein